MHPTRSNAAFVCCMEDVLDLYKQPYDVKRPLICMDENSPGIFCLTLGRHFLLDLAVPSVLTTSMSVAVLPTSCSSLNLSRDNGGLR